ncbi:MAG: 50S ribosomal protein L27 [Patescibacteria group bacterium]|nr:50S ribosomal protein L27 [Patescibacteria group bacterium]
MAHKKALGSAKKNRDSAGRRLGVKVYGEQNVGKGEIIIRQRGTKHRAGANVAYGKDYTIYSKIDGIVKFIDKKVSSFTGNKKRIKVVSVSSK